VAAVSGATDPAVMYIVTKTRRPR